jgi:quinol monooxygenase YgiN
LIYVVATLNVKPGMAGKVIEAALPNIAGTRTEAGNLSYDMHSHIEDGNRLVLVECWESRAHLSAHFNAPHFMTYRAATKDLLESRKVEIIEAAKVEVI